MSDLNSFGFIWDVGIESDHPVHTLISNRSCLALLWAEWVLYFHPEGSERITGAGDCRGNRPGPVWVRIDPAGSGKKKDKVFMTVTFMTVIKMLLVTAATAVLTSTGFATSYEELVKNAYQWAAIDGPFACPAKSDVPVIVKNADNDELRLHMVEQLRAYY